MHFNLHQKSSKIKYLKWGSFFFENAYYEFTKDTVYWTDINPREKKVVLKKGKWIVSGDTLKVFDYEKIKPYNYLLKVNSSSNEFEMLIVFPNNSIARNKLVYSKK